MRALIADDEAPARRKLRRLLDAEHDMTVVGEASNGREAVEAIAEQKPDLVFLDVQMPELDGFAVVDAIGVDAMPPTVFVTAYDEHALKAFEVRAIDYLLKPFTPERFRSVLANVRTRYGGGPQPADSQQLAQLLQSVATPPRYLRRILVHRDEKAFLLPVEKIDRVEAERNYVRLHTASGAFQLRGTLTALSARLDPAMFLRINRSELVRLDAIAELHPWFHGDYRVVLRDGSTRMWSRRFRAQAEGEFGS
ncbi:MAG TPA: LytTR family DNA-binding domain-containing protein [Gemmatimonadaceae bacterium]|nr:LytTR family DNA-binding domain-containing protein [Gemmatimonadaceae bacterium]